MRKLYLLLFLTLQAPLFGAPTAGEYLNAGMTFYQQGQYEKAVPFFKAAIQLDGTQWQAYQYMGQSYYALGRNVEAYEALNKSLDIYADNQPVKDLVRKLTPSVMVPPMPPVKKTPVVVVSKGVTIREGLPMEPRMWFKLTGKMDYSLIGDFNKAVDGWKYMAGQLGAAAKGSSGNWGIGSKLEFGNALDKDNAILLDLSAMMLDGFTGNATDGINSFAESILPLVVGLELDYCRVFPHDDWRFYLKGGVGYYYSFVDFHQTVTGSFGTLFSEYGVLGNGDFGFNLGAGYEIRMEKDFGVELTLGFRYAVISQIVGSAGGGTVVGLAVTHNGYIGAIDTKLIGAPTNSRFANLDLTGAEAGLSLIYYIF